jgi:hypothetical protein
MDKASFRRAELREVLVSSVAQQQEVQARAAAERQAKAGAAQRDFAGVARQLHELAASCPVRVLEWAPDGEIAVPFGDKIQETNVSVGTYKTLSLSARGDGKISATQSEPGTGAKRKSFRADEAGTQEAVDWFVKRLAEYVAPSPGTVRRSRTAREGSPFSIGFL